MAAEMLRYTGPKKGPLAWTEEDTKGVNAFIAIGKDFWWGRGTFLNQLQFSLGGPMARAIWNNDSAAYAEAVEILTSNKYGPKGEGNGSIEQMCRLMTTNEVDDVKVKDPHVQFIEMGRDIGHPFPGAGALADNLTIAQSQGTRVDPVTGEVSTKANAGLPIEFLGHRYLRGVNQICKYNLGFDIRWTPVYINRQKNQTYTLPWNWGGGRGRIVNVMDVLYNHYRYVRNLPFARSEETRYFGYGKCIGGNDAFYEFLFMPPEAEGKWKQEWIDPGHDGKSWFAEFLQPKMEGLSTVYDKISKRRYISLKNERKLMFPMFLKSRKPLPKPGTYILKYRSDRECGLGVINPEDYPTEFVDGDPKKKRIYTDRVLLPKTGKSWKEYSFELKNPPNRNLIKLEFRTKGTYLDLEWLQVPQ